MLKTHKGILQRVKREKNLRKSLGKGKISVSQIKMRKKAKKKKDFFFFDYKKPKKGKGTPIKSSEGKKIEQTPRMVREERERKTHTTLHYTTRIIQPRNEKTTKKALVLLLLDGEQLFYLNINM